MSSPRRRYRPAIVYEDRNGDLQKLVPPSMAEIGGGKSRLLSGTVLRDPSVPPFPDGILGPLFGGVRLSDDEEIPSKTRNPCPFSTAPSISSHGPPRIGTWDSTWGPYVPREAASAAGISNMSRAASLRSAAGRRRVVYCFDDTYRFERLLQSSDIVFDSHFECGNLFRATRVVSGAHDPRPVWLSAEGAKLVGIGRLGCGLDAFGVGSGSDRSREALLERVGEIFDRRWHEYDLELQPDVHSAAARALRSGEVSKVRRRALEEEEAAPSRGKGKGRQWYCFSMRNVPVLTPVVFHIHGFAKGGSLAERGALPVVGTCVDGEWKWTRLAPLGPIGYYPTPDGGSLSTLSFSAVFDSPGPHILSAAVPYPFSRVQRLVRHCETFRTDRLVVRASALTQTLAGHTCPAITLGRLTTKDSQTSLPLSRRPVAFFSARVHPCEAPASWAMEGLIHALLQAGRTHSVK